MILEELRVRALYIGNVTEDYEAEIEGYHSEAGVAVFAWKQKGNEELGLWIELSKDGSLIR
jgi:hypothetical protein